MGVSAVGIKAVEAPFFIDRGRANDRINKINRKTKVVGKEGWGGGKAGGREWGFGS